MTFSVTLSGLFILAIVVAILALIDGITRLRGRRASSVFAVIEIIAAALLALSQFFTMPFPLTALVFSIVLEVVLVIALILRGGRNAWIVTIAALVLNTLLLLKLLGWLTIPGIL
jgi:hypothetical protein